MTERKMEAIDCIFSDPIDMTVEVFNYERRKHHVLMDGISSGKIRLLCDRCGKPVNEQKHEDSTMHPPRVQVVCPSCTWTGYRVL